MVHMDFLIGPKQEVIDETDEHKQNYTRKKREMKARLEHEKMEMEAILGYEISYDKFYRFKISEEIRHREETKYHEGEQKKEKEIIFNMFAKGFDNETIIEIVPTCSFEELEKLREEWRDANSSENAD